MKKILGILAVVLLVCGTANAARPQKAETTGPPSLTGVIGSEIGVIFGRLSVAEDNDIFMSINRLAVSMSNIGVQVGDTAIFMGENETTTRPMPGAVFDSVISICFKQAAVAVIHTGKGTEVNQLLKGPRSIALIHARQSV
ncbi:hypothetical protein HYV69_00655 [Candidatus Uhrbacteria bacterium]|nr:hypothetical protein [Candidatus Uhrbacteria bacterium]